MIPRILLSLMGAVVIGATGSMWVLGTTPATAQTASDQRACEHAGKQHLAGDRVCIEDRVSICNGQTGEWVATQETCAS